MCFGFVCAMVLHCALCRAHGAAEQKEGTHWCSHCCSSSAHLCACACVQADHSGFCGWRTKERRRACEGGLAREWSHRHMHADNVASKTTLMHSFLTSLLCPRFCLFLRFSVSIFGLYNVKRKACVRVRVCLGLQSKRASKRNSKHQEMKGSNHRECVKAKRSERWVPRHPSWHSAG